MSVDHRSAVKWIFMDVASAAPVNQTFFQEGKKESQLVQQYMCFSEYGYQKGMTRDKAGYSLGRKKIRKKKTGQQQWKKILQSLQYSGSTLSFGIRNTAEVKRHTMKLYEDWLYP